MRLRGYGAKIAIFVAKMSSILANMEEDLNKFMPHSIMRNDKHINISEYITKRQCASVICRKRPLEKTCKNVTRLEF